MMDHNNHRPHRANQPAWQAIKDLGLEHDEVRLEHFHLLCRLGCGDIGNVFLCEIKECTKPQYSRCYYAMKVVDRDSLRMKNKLKRADMEKHVLSMLDHPFLPTLYAKFDAYQYSYFIMDYCHGGDLFNLQQHQPGLRFSISTAKFYAAEVLLALEYLHMMGIIYRDLKPENVLIQEDGHVMLSDFDLSLHWEVHPKLLKRYRIQNKRNKKKKSLRFCCEEDTYIDIEKRKKKKKKKKAAIADGTLEGAKGVDVELSAEPINARSKSFVGTHEYLAPEVVMGLGHGSAVDWWAFGVFLYELLYGFTPFKDKNNEETLKNIIGQTPLTFPRTQFRDKKEGEEMAKAQDLIRKLLVRNPKKRSGYSRGSCEIKRHEFFEGMNWALIRSAKPPIIPRDENKISLSMPKLSLKEKATIQASHQFDFF